MDKIELKYEDVLYEMAVPAKRRDILLWLLTGGRKGKLFTRETKEFRKWMAPQSTVNCRCSTVKNITLHYADCAM